MSEEEARAQRAAQDAVGSANADYGAKVSALLHELAGGLQGPRAHLVQFAASLLQGTRISSTGPCLSRACRAPSVHDSVPHHPGLTSDIMWLATPN